VTTVHRYVAERVDLLAAAAAGHAFLQSLRRGHYEIATDVSPPRRLATDFAEFALTM
jgi:IS6 family transposase